MTQPKAEHYGSAVRSRPGGGLLVVACAAVLLVLINYTIPLGMLGPISHDLDATLGDRAWVLSGGALGVAASLLPAGSLADGLGRKRVFVVAATAFAVLSVVGAVAASALMLIVVRVLQGVASGALLAGSLAMIAATFTEARERERATGLWAAMIGAGIAIGPVLGALLSTAVSWRLSYGVLALFGAVLAIAAVAMFAESRAGHSRRVDWPGMALLAAGLGALVAGLLRGNPDGWTAVHVLGLLAAAAVLLAVFVAVEHRRREPMLELQLLRHRGFTAAFVGSLVLGASVIAFMNYFPTWSEQTAGSSVIAVSLQLLLWSVPSVLVAVRADLVGRVLGPRPQLIVGMSTCLLGLVLLFGIDPQSLWTHLIPAFIIAGIGTGMLNAALAHAAVDTVPAESVGLGAGANNTARYVGNALGIAALTALASGSNLLPAITAAAGLAAVGVLVAVLIADKPASPRPTVATEPPGAPARSDR